jgi:phage protein D
MVVTVYVNGTSTNISDDLEELTYTETLDNEAHTVDVKVRDTDLKYRNKWFIKKGSQLTVQITQVEWLDAGETYTKRGTGTMWVDTVEMQLKPRSMQFKATSVDPKMEKGGKKHKGSEGQKVSQKVKSDTSGDFLDATPAAPDPPVKRTDQENESDLTKAKRLAAEQGKKIMVVNGKLVMYRECDMEAQAPSFTFHDDGTEKDSPFLGGKIKTTNQDKVKGGKHQYHDPKTGKLVTTTIDLGKAAPDGTQAVHNSRKRPALTGLDDQYESYKYGLGMQPHVPGGGNPQDPEFA